MSTGIEVPKALDAIPIVANSTDRDTRYPTPSTNQRVFRLDTSNVERYTGSAWVIATAGYEEGAWTPAFAGTTIAGTFSYSKQVGHYIKLGNLILAQCYLNAQSASVTPTGTITITGLPYPAANVTNLYGAGAIREQGGFTLSGGFTTLDCGVSPGSTVLALTKSASGLASLVVPATDASYPLYILATVVYATQ